MNYFSLYSPPNNGSNYVGFGIRKQFITTYDVRVDHKTGTLLAPVWVTNDAGIIYLPNRERLIICVFSRGTETDLNEAQIKAAISNAEGVIGEIGKIAFDYYTTTEASKHD